VHADHPELLDVAGAILDGDVADWTALESSAPDSLQSLIGELRAIAAIGRVTRSFASRAYPERVGFDGDAWGPLRIVGSLGRGAFGAVYRAWDPTLEREVALKLLPPGDAASAAAIKEGRLLARVHHPNVVTVFGSDVNDGRPGIWMELVEGATLEEIVKRDGPLPASRVAEIGRQLCDALATVHAAGLMHRDVKTSNIMATPSGRVVLMDFGTGRPVDSAARDIAGTPLYLAPEVITGGPPSPLSDIYALGVVMYRLLTGSYPVAARTGAEVRAAHLRQSPRAQIGSLTSARIPRRLAQAVGRALDPDLSRRFATANAMGSALRLPDGRSRIVALAAISAAAVVAFGVALNSPLHWGATSTRASVLPPLAPETPRSHRLTLPADAEIFLAGLSADGRVYSYTAGDGAVRQMRMDDGAVQTILTPERGRDAEFAVTSSDGRQVAYMWWNDHNAYEVRIVNRDTAAIRTVLNDEAVAIPQPIQWSGDDSTLLVLERLKDQRRQMAVVDIASGAVHTVRTFAEGSPLGVSISPDARFVAYDMPASGGSGGRTVHLVRADGTDDRVLLSAEGLNDWAPLWTADGSGLFFLSDRSGAPDGWFVRVNEGSILEEPHVLVRNLARTIPLGITRSGALYYRVRTGAFDIFEVRPDEPTGSAPVRLGGRLWGTSIGPSYANDGRQIAFISVRDGYSPDADRAIVIRDLVSGEERELRPSAGVGNAPPRWSPDDRSLLVRGAIPGGGSGIQVVDAATGRVRRVVARVPDEEQTEYGPVGWYPEGLAVVYEQSRRGLVRQQLASGAEDVVYSYERSGGDHGRIHRFGFTAARGVRLAFSAMRTPRTRSALHLVENGVRRELVAADDSSMVVFQGWSGDGRWIYYTVVPDGARPHELWRVSPDSGDTQQLPLTIPGATQLNPMSVNPVTGALSYTGGTPMTEIWVMDGFLPH
jgi:Tol biopolymer transport system component